MSYIVKHTFECQLTNSRMMPFETEVLLTVKVIVSHAVSLAKLSYKETIGRGVWKHSHFIKFKWYKYILLNFKSAEVSL